ncbi:hypothetical protein OG562_07770 [Streptomyces sp. NBC_01275]|uniref:hypothetical protein n=1 Tax=Streptomyces sp. NBC_01275 TaxID=2903807 RepID=UPI00224FAC46|nr:hypothetical protein [Streptomyces sp. NBC_01275]MCX4760866.1 hypothetical protein [Streptomyces sp. NBC_01275]
MYVTPRPRRVGARTAALAALTVAGSALTGAPAFAVAPMAPGDNGTVKIHSASDPRTPVGDPRDEPKVCEFYIDAAHFDDLEQGQNISYTIETQPLDPNGATLQGQITLDPDGTGHTGDIELPDDQYKLVWTIVGGNGTGKQKVFQVDCVTPPTSPPPTSPPPTTGPPTSPPPNGSGGPHGGPPAGGGGAARDVAAGPVVGAVGVGLAAVGGAVWFRLRRRPHGSA